MKKSIIFIAYILILVPFVVSAKSNCVTSADFDCDQKVNFSEIIKYIDIWYKCSECASDIFNAFNSFFDIPFCGDYICSGSENSASCPKDCSADCTDRVIYEAVTWLRMDDDANDGALDSTANGRNGMCVSDQCPDFIEGEGPFGNGAYEFDGNDYLEIDTSTFDFGTNGEFTVSFWFKRASASTGKSVLVDRGPIYQPFSVSIEDDKRLKFSTRCSSSMHYYQPVDQVDLHKWYHIAYAFSENELSVYVDGNEIFSENPGDFLNPFVNRNIYIGRYSNDLSGEIYFFTGMMDDVRVYDNFLTENEILSIKDGLCFQTECGYSGLDPIEECDDGLWCNGQSECIAGKCVDGIPVDCNDNIQCTIDSCNDNIDACVNSPDHAVCPATECENRDMCIGKDYYDYSDVENLCTSLGCESNACSDFTVTENHPDCSGDVYYINPGTGSNANPGTKNLPWKDFTNVPAQSSSGDVIYVTNATRGLDVEWPSDRVYFANKLCKRSHDPDNYYYNYNDVEKDFPEMNPPDREICWTFNDHYRVGQFINLDFWVSGEVTVIKIEPQSVLKWEDGPLYGEGNENAVDENGDLIIKKYPRIIHGSMLNPVPYNSLDHPEDAVQGFDSELNSWGAGMRNEPHAHFYDETKNVARYGDSRITGPQNTATYLDPDQWNPDETWKGHPINSSRPLVVPVDTSLVSSYSKRNLWWDNDYVIVDGEYYKCIAEHISSIENKPGYGSEWDKRWQYYGTSPPPRFSGSGWLAGTRYDDGVRGGSPLTQMWFYAGLTTLGSIPEEKSFRPTIFGNDKTIYFTEDDLPEEYNDKLKNVQFDQESGIYGINLKTYSDKYSRLCFDLNSRAALNQINRPSDSCSTYGWGIAMDAGTAALLLNIDATDAEKRELLIAYIQTGIDNYHFMEMMPYDASGIWPAGEGQNMGRKLPIILAGYLLGGTDTGTDQASKMYNIGNWWTTADHIKVGNDWYMCIQGHRSVDNLAEDLELYWRKTTEFTDYPNSNFEPTHASQVKTWEPNKMFSTGFAFQEDTGTFYVAEKDIDRYVSGVNKNLPPGIIGSDDNWYRSIKRHVSSPDNYPVSGTQWEEYWEPTNTVPVTKQRIWTSGVNYAGPYDDEGRGPYKPSYQYSDKTTLVHGVSGIDTNGDLVTIPGEYYRCIKPHFTGGTTGSYASGAGSTIPTIGHNWQDYWEICSDCTDDDVTEWPSGEWIAASVGYGLYGFWTRTSDLGKPEWGSRHYGSNTHYGAPSLDDAFVDAAYRGIHSTGVNPTAFTVSIMGLEDKFMPAMLDYQDRWHYSEDMSNLSTRMASHTSSFVKGFWEEFRFNYGCVWMDVDKYDCNEDGTPDVNIDCTTIETCADYSGNALACRRDPCRLGCKNALLHN